MARIIARANKRVFIVEQNSGDEFPTISITYNGEKEKFEDQLIDIMKRWAQLHIDIMVMEKGYLPFIPEADQIDGIYVGLKAVFGEENLEVEGDPYFRYNEWMDKVYAEDPNPIF